MPNPGMGKALFANHCAGCHGGDLKGSEKGAAPAAQDL